MNFFVFLLGCAYAIIGNDYHIKGRRKLSYTGKSCIECMHDYPMQASIVNKGNEVEENYTESWKCLDLCENQKSQQKQLFFIQNSTPRVSRKEKNKRTLLSLLHVVSFLHNFFLEAIFFTIWMWKSNLITCK